jgi:flavin-dependent dehydrogenase
MRIAVVGAGVAGSYLLNRLDGHEVECFEQRQQDKWYTVCAWGTSQPYISAMVKKAGFNFDDYVLHKGKTMVVDYGKGSFVAPLKGLVSYDKHRLCEDMLKGHKVHWGTQVKGINDGKFDGFDMVVDATGMPRSLLPKIPGDIIVPCVEYQVKSTKFPWDDFYIKPYKNMSGYLWFFPLGEGMAHVGAGELHAAYRGELEVFLKKYDCEVVRKIGRPVRIVPPSRCLPFSQGKVVGVGESIGTVYPMLGEGIIPSMQCVETLVENLHDMKRYQEEVLRKYAIYSKVFKFVKSRIEGNFSLVRNFPELLSIYVHMRSNVERYGLETRLTDMLKLTSV